MLDSVLQTRKTELLLHLGSRSVRPDFRLLLRREERGSENNAEVRQLRIDLMQVRLPKLSLRLLGILEEKRISRGIIVFPGNMTPSARKVRIKVPIHLKGCADRNLRSSSPWPDSIDSRSSPKLIYWSTLPDTNLFLATMCFPLRRRLLYCKNSALKPTFLLRL